MRNEAMQYDEVVRWILKIKNNKDKDVFFCKKEQTFWKIRASIFITAWKSQYFGCVNTTKRTQSNSGITVSAHNKQQEKVKSEPNWIELNWEKMNCNGNAIGVKDFGKEREEVGIVKVSFLGKRCPQKELRKGIVLVMKWRVLFVPNYFVKRWV